MISKKEVVKIANLARIELSGQEEEKFALQLNDIVKHVDALSQVKDKEPELKAVENLDWDPDEMEEQKDKNGLIDKSVDLYQDYVRTKKVI